MEIVHDLVVPLPPDEAFERMRRFARLYPRMHPAHLPHAAEPPLLAPGARFTAAERFGPERRDYAFTVEACDAAARTVVLTATAVTRVGPLRVRSRLVLDWTVAPHPEGAAVRVRQVATLTRPWLAPLLLGPRARARLRAHADEEVANARALYVSPDWSG